MVRQTAAALVFIAMPLAGCFADGDNPAGRTPAQRAAQDAACVVAGGDWAVVGLMGLGCVLPTTDGGKACTRSTDFQSLCIANPEGSGGSCLDRSTVGGCYALLNADGVRKEICID